MSDWTEVPDWVWALLDALDAYEDEHPILYRMTAADEYQRTVCFGGFLTDRGAWPPREIRDAAAFRRHVIRDATPRDQPTAEAVTVAAASEEMGA